MLVLFILTLPDKLRVQRRVSRVENRLRLLVLVGEKRAKFGGRNVAATGLIMDCCLDTRLRLLILRHLLPPSARAPRCEHESHLSPCTDHATPCSPTARYVPTHSRLEARDSSLFPLWRAWPHVAHPLPR